MTTDPKPLPGEVREPMPCPFCKGGCSIATVEYGEKSEQKRLNGQSLFFYINCRFCGANNLGLVGHRSGESAIAAWNTRPSSPEVDRLREERDAWKRYAKALTDPNGKYNSICSRAIYDAAFAEIVAAEAALKAMGVEI